MGKYKIKKVLEEEGKALLFNPRGDFLMKVHYPFIRENASSWKKVQEWDIALYVGHNLGIEVVPSDTWDTLRRAEALLRLG